MNLRMIILGCLCCVSLHLAAENRPDQQQMAEAIERYEQQFLGNISASTTALAGNVRWMIIEAALASLVAHNGTDKLVSKAVLGGLGFLGACELLSCAVNMLAFRAAIKEHQEFRRHVANMYAGLQMHDEALDDDVLEA